MLHDFHLELQFDHLPISSTFSETWILRGQRTHLITQSMKHSNYCAPKCGPMHVSRSHWDLFQKRIEEHENKYGDEHRLSTRLEVEIHHLNHIIDNEWSEERIMVHTSTIYFYQRPCSRGHKEITMKKGFWEPQSLGLEAWHQF